MIRKFRRLLEHFFEPGPLRRAENRGRFIVRGHRSAAKHRFVLRRLLQRAAEVAGVEQDDLNALSSGPKALRVIHTFLLATQ
jgi:hypothetical protein